MVECNDYDEYVKLKQENEKLKKEFEVFKTHNTIVLETLDHDGDLVLENEKLKEENKKLKEERNKVTLKEDKSSDALKEENKKLKLEREHPLQDIGPSMTIFWIMIDLL